MALHNEWNGAEGDCECVCVSLTNCCWGNGYNAHGSTELTHSQPFRKLVISNDSLFLSTLLNNPCKCFNNKHKLCISAFKPWKRTALVYVHCKSFTVTMFCRSLNVNNKFQ